MLLEVVRARETGARSWLLEESLVLRELFDIFLCRSRPVSAVRERSGSSVADLEADALWPGLAVRFAEELLCWFIELADLL